MFHGTGFGTVLSLTENYCRYIFLVLIYLINFFIATSQRTLGWVWMGNLLTQNFSLHWNFMCACIPGNPHDLKAWIGFLSHETRRSSNHLRAEMNQRNWCVIFGIIIDTQLRLEVYVATGIVATVEFQPKSGYLLCALVFWFHSWFPFVHMQEMWRVWRSFRRDWLVMFMLCMRHTWVRYFSITSLTSVKKKLT